MLPGRRNRRVYHVAECVSYRDLLALRGEWDALVAGADTASVFADWAWTAATWAGAVPGKHPLVLTVRDEAGALVAVLPLARAPHLRVLGALEVLGCGPGGYPLADYWGLATARGAEGAVWTALLGYLGRRPGWSMIDLRNCMPGPLSEAHYRQAAATRGWAVRVESGELCRRLSLAPTFDDYLAGLSANSRQQIRRKLRKLRDDGLTIVPVDVRDPAARDAAMNLLFDYHQARWAADPSGGGFPDARRQAMHRKLAALLAERDKLDLRVVRAADGTCGGVIYNFHQGDVTYYYQLGLNPDPRFASYSLGVCLLADTIAAAIAAGRQSVDLLRGDHDYKRHFGGHLRANLRVTMYRRRWLPLVEEAARGLHHRARLVRARAGRQAAA
jgi:CelD/BcsL family acetyltransferase involved in cellulose biosynthesis